MADAKIEQYDALVTFAKPSVAHENVDDAQVMAILSHDEIRRAGSFRFERDRRLFTFARALVRRTLSRYVNVPPSSWRFGSSPLGRPFILFPTEARTLRFSASHTDGLVMCAVAAGRDVGADVERVLDCAPLEIADRFFASREAEAIRASNGAEQTLSFFSYWTLKESYIKARGLGLSLPMNKFSFRLSPGASPSLHIDPGLGDQAAGWHFLSLRPTQSHCAALCIRNLEKSNVCIATDWDHISH
jgi:4'-phosphopantetheinyl transferase